MLDVKILIEWDVTWAMMSLADRGLELVTPDRLCTIADGLCECLACCRSVFFFEILFHIRNDYCSAIVPSKLDRLIEMRRETCRLNIAEALLNSRSR